MFEHWGDTIYWDRLSWEAFVATLAVLAAGIVGWRQAGVVKEQAKLQQLALRHGLFERRHSVYHAARAWLGFVVAQGTIPNRQPDGEDRPQPEWTTHQALEREFLDGLDMSRFVFRPAVFEELHNLWLAGNQLHYHRVAARKRDENAEMHRKNEATVFATISENYRNIAAVFGEELRLDDGGAVDLRPVQSAQEAEAAAVAKDVVVATAKAMLRFGFLR